MHFRSVFIFVMLGSVLLLISPNYALTQDKAAGIEPVIRLEKPQYVLGEAIRFWIGVKPKDSPVIAQEFRTPCSLAITKPDGTIEKQAVGWPEDGPMDRGWLTHGRAITRTCGELISRLWSKEQIRKSAA